MPTMIPRHFHLSQRSIKTRFAYRFLRALKRLNKPRTNVSSSRSTSASCIRETTSRRYHMVKTAAYASMAAAVGTKRAWSRALLWKIRNRSLSRTRVVMKRNNKSHRASSILSSKKTSILKENPNKASQLQKLVPGGEVMDFCSLLDETAHYIRCLTSQVKKLKYDEGEINLCLCS